MTSRLRTIIVLLGSLVLASTALERRIAGQVRDGGKAVAGVGALAGRVVSDDGRPIERAFVVLSRSGRPARDSVTDRDGRFTFESLAAGQYQMLAVRTGYVDESVWADPTGRTVTIDPGTTLERLITIARAAAVEGRVVDEHGQGVPGMTVVVDSAAVRVVPARDRRLPAMRVTTRHDGSFRASGLPPGEYVVMVDPSTGPGARSSGTAASGQALHRLNPFGIEERVGLLPTYFGDTTLRTRARRLTLESGEVRLGVDIALVPVPVAELVAEVTWQGAPVQYVSAQLVNLDDAGREPLLRSVAGTEDLVFGAVPAGRYRLSLEASARGDARDDGTFATARLWAAADVTTDGYQPVRIPVPATQGRTVNGDVRFVTTTGRTPPPFAGLSAVLSGIGSPGAAELVGGRVIGYVDDSGRFRFEGVPPGSYVIAIAGHAIPGWRLSSVGLDGREILDLPISIESNRDIAGLRLTLTDRHSVVDGAIEPGPDDGRPATIAVIPADERYWHLHSTRVRVVHADDRGRFTIEDLPPGAYLAARIPSALAPTAWTTERLRAIASAAVRFSVVEGGRTEVTLRR